VEKPVATISSGSESNCDLIRVIKRIPERRIGSVRRKLK